MIKNIIFDLDGTLAETYKDIIFSVNYALRKAKIKKKINLIIFKQIANLGSITMFKKILFKYDKTTIYEVNNIFINHYTKNICIRSKLKKNILFFLKRCKRNKVKLFVSTNKNNIVAKILLKKLKIIKYFKYIIGFNTYKYKKPSPLHLKAICERFNLKKEEILYVGDTEIDSIMASKYRVKFVLITNGYTTLRPDRISYDFLTSDYKRLYKTLRIKKLIA